MSGSDGAPPVPTLLLDTCAIINLSYCPPVAALFKDRYRGRAGWARAVQVELVRQRGRRPPHPQAGRASNWAATWLPLPLEITTSSEQVAVARIQAEIAVGSEDDNLDHLGEAASIHLLAEAGTGRLISDDHSARTVARSHGVRAASTAGVVTALLARTLVPPATAELYVDTLREHKRMHAELTLEDLFAGHLGPWA